MNCVSFSSHSFSLPHHNAVVTDEKTAPIVVYAISFLKGSRPRPLTKGKRLNKGHLESKEEEEEEEAQIR